MILISTRFVKMTEKFVLDGTMMDLTFLGPFVSSTLLAKIAPSIYWLFDHPKDGTTSIYWMASRRWMVATTVLVLLLFHVSNIKVPNLDELKKIA